MLDLKLNSPGPTVYKESVENALRETRPDQCAIKDAHDDPRPLHVHVHFALVTEEVEILRLPSSGSLRMTPRSFESRENKGSSPDRAGRNSGGRHEVRRKGARGDAAGMLALGGDGFRGGRNYQAGAGEEFIGFHPEGENGADKEQDDAADKR
jgi:hypothetical protein